MRLQDSNNKKANSSASSPTALCYTLYTPVYRSTCAPYVKAVVYVHTARTFSLAIRYSLRGSCCIQYSAKSKGHTECRGDTIHGHYLNTSIVSPKFTSFYPESRAKPTRPLTPSTVARFPCSQPQSTPKPPLPPTCNTPPTNNSASSSSLLQRRAGGVF